MKPSVADRMFSGVADVFLHTSEQLAYQSVQLPAGKLTDIPGGPYASRVVWYLSVPGASEIVEAAKKGQPLPTASRVATVEVQYRANGSWHTIHQPARWPRDAAFLVFWATTEIELWRRDERAWPTGQEALRAVG